jgi:hypothetical protein
MHDQENDSDEEQNPRDLRGHRRYSKQSKGAGHQPNQQKDERVVKHVDFLLNRGLRNLRARMPERRR